MRDFEIGEMNLFVRHIFELPLDAESRVAARLKQMQRVHFPARGKVGQGYRRTYGIEEVLKVAVAFQLMDVGLPTALAVRVIAAHWPVISGTLGGVVTGAKARVAIAPNLITGLSNAALKSWKGGTSATGDQIRSALAGGVRSAGKETRPAPSPLIMIDVTGLVRSVKLAIKSVEGVATDEIEDALANLADEASRKAGARADDR